ncbi:farnesol dehydrogenase-like [Hetaerina americana]|uniref:farnesol dehydrogenase-like n=1 Tax=Hetaerina americana TaxID=62018 RepID=UPI003A7F30D1
MERWAGKVAVVTGSSSGIGASIATELVERGMIVVGLARRVELVQELANKLSGCKGQLHAIKADVSKEEDVVEVFEWVRENLGAVHVLVNNAAACPFTIMSNMEREHYKKVQGCFDTNVMGPIMCTNEAIKLMKEKGIEDGHIININSVAGHYVSNSSGFHIYGATKHALRVITEGLRRELVQAKSKIRTTSISPGYVDTDFGKTSGVADFEKLVAGMPSITTGDVTNTLIHVLEAPSSVQIAEVIVRPLGEQF